ncbi:tetratricopeptide repeat protein [Flavobacterium sp.]|uniref:tetratricopeptide repeat protein n=1 Tax=Flavobacterium sp. TaxID=239 RepID=UPI003D6A7CD8
MKKHLFLCVLFILSSILYGQNNAKKIAESNSLVKEKKYESAFQVLDKLDPKNDNPEIFLLKQDIVLNYFVTSLSHKMFSLKDIKPDEDIMDYRRSDSSSSAMVNFDIEASLEKLIKNNPKNYKLCKSLADYYYDAFLKYGGRWLKSDEELKGLIKKNYEIAIQNNAGDYMSHYSLGYLYILDEKYKESIPYFLKSIELNSTYPTSAYNVSIAYMYINDLENALKYAVKSYELYTDEDYKSDAARIASQMCFELKDIDNAIKYINLADKNAPKNYYNIKLMLELYLVKKDPKLDEATVTFFNLAPSNPTTYNDLKKLFYKYEMGDKLLLFLNQQKVKTGYDDKVLGSIYFYLATMYVDKDKKLVAENASQAKNHFGKIFEKDHQVFSLIDELIKNSGK